MFFLLDPMQFLLCPYNIFGLVSESEKSLFHRDPVSATQHGFAKITGLSSLEWCDGVKLQVSSHLNEKRVSISCAGPGTHSSNGLLPSSIR